jgi:FtsZ-interacting cell division protein ZipA
MDLTLQTIALVAVGVVAGALIVGAVWMLMRERGAGSDSRHLKKRFGPEYDRAVDKHRSRREAELDLMSREQRARELTIRPLEPERVEQMRRSWHAVQRNFVDEPQTALASAHDLLERLMLELGYPTESYSDEVELISVHHPEAIDHYRDAHRLHYERARRDDTTETRRQALLHYRELFAVLLDETVESDAEDARDIPLVHPSPEWRNDEHAQDAPR